MKKTITVITIVCFSMGVTQLTAQTDMTAAPDTTVLTAATPQEESHIPRLEIGFRFMPTITKFKLETFDGGTVQGTATFGYGIGGLVGFNFTNHIGVQAEIIYNSLSQKYKDKGLERTIHVDYINVPILLSLNTGKSGRANLCFVAGPQFGYNVGNRIKTSGSNGTDTLEAVIVVKKGNSGFAYGADFQLSINERSTLRLDIGFRGVFGFVSIREDKDDANTRTFNVIADDNMETYSIFAGLTLLF